MTGIGIHEMLLDIRIPNFSPEEICDLLLQDDRQATDILAKALKQLILEMAGLDAKPSAADVLSQLEKAA